MFRLKRELTQEERKVREEREEHVYKRLVIIKDTVYILVWLTVLALGIIGLYKGPEVTLPIMHDYPFVEIEKSYADYPVLEFSQNDIKIAIGMAAKDFLYEIGLDQLKEKYPDYEYSKSSLIEIPAFEMKAVLRDDRLVFFSVNNYKLKDIYWLSSHRISLGDPIEKVSEKYEVTETVHVDAPEGKEPADRIVCPIKGDEVFNGYVVYKYDDKGEIREICAGLDPDTVNGYEPYYKVYWLNFLWSFVRKIR